MNEDQKPLSKEESEIEACYASIFQLVILGFVVMGIKIMLKNLDYSKADTIPALGFCCILAVVIVGYIIRIFILKRTIQTQERGSNDE